MEVGVRVLIGGDFLLQRIFLREGPAKIEGLGLIVEVGLNVET